MKPKILWQPNQNLIDNSHINKFIKWLAEEKKLKFEDYNTLWDWSVEEYERFWQLIVEYFNIELKGDYHRVCKGTMPRASWFEGTSVNYAYHVFRNENHLHPAIIFSNETGDYYELSWKELRQKVASFARYLKSIGVGVGDRVTAFLPNVPEATIAFLATNSLGAIWSSTSPDFGVDSVVDRFAQIEPKVFIAVDGYTYNGKPYDKTDVVEEIKSKLPTVEKLILLKYLNKEKTYPALGDYIDIEECMKEENIELVFEDVPFEHPIWVLYSSGTTGLPKAITHSVGGVLLEHYKYLAFHNDVHPGERFFWYSTTGWMMWNFVQASFLMGATVVLYEGGAAFPDINSLWKFAEKAGINHFGTSAPFIVACMKAGIKPKDICDLSRLRSISSTGAPLPPEGFDWIYENVKEDVWLASMSGGTDVCTAFVGGNPLWPVREGEIQCRALGAAVYAFDIDGRAVYDEVGEMVITKPMPSMPIYFWNDKDFTRYEDSYFAHYANVWRHGDWIKINSKTKGLVILGRSDATLNRHGVRIGTAEIYRAIDMVAEVKDSLIVNLELEGGKHFMPLFVIMNDGFELDENVVNKIKTTLKKEYSPRHVPDEIIEVVDLPYTISGKKMEAPVKKILLGFDLKKAINIDSMRNPESVEFFIEFAKKIG